jgi:hypothetical protein
MELVLRSSQFDSLNRYGTENFLTIIKTLPVGMHARRKYRLLFMIAASYSCLSPFILHIAKISYFIYPEPPKTLIDMN